MPACIKLSVIIPVFNEESTIIDLLKKVQAQCIENVLLEVIVVDDSSSDDTYKILLNHPDLYAQLCRHSFNQGKGAAVQTALQYATGDYVLFQDADLEYDPNDYKKLFEPIINLDADVVMGSRMSGALCTRVHYFWHKVGNHALTFFFNIINNTTFTDVYSCYLIYRRELVDPDKLKTMNWEQHAEILTKAVRKAKKIYEVPIHYYGRSYEEGKKIRWYHTFSVMIAMFRFRFFNQERLYDHRIKDSKSSTQSG